MITKSDDERFQDGAQDYAAYLEYARGPVARGPGVCQPAGFSSRTAGEEADVVHWT